ncbi:MAG: glucose-1-phosphate adenylyltransferase [Candidatus Omnitrophica bacterium]|nr:glucose-1-phosphate adenylyltransferase [Candidatus Omnitrophota bacterium]
MSDVLCVILGGGRGRRLSPLTKERCKPAVPLAGQYRLIDVPISNCLNSMLNKIYVLTQFNSESLNKHIARTYTIDRFSGGFVEIMAAEQSSDSNDWFQGTADAVRRCLKHFDEPLIKRILILSGDQLYKFNLRDLLDFHFKKNAEITLACHPVDRSIASDFGIIGIEEDSKVVSFFEKPKDIDAITDYAVQVEGKERFLASMGIYLFEKKVLVELLSNSKKVDFGREVLPGAFAHKNTKAFLFEGYWQDIGTIRSFYDANLMLTDPLPRIDMFDEYWPFFSRARNLPPAKIQSSRIQLALISNGCIIEDATIKHSVMGLRSRVWHSTLIEDSIIMGCDYYETLDEMVANEQAGIPSLGIGRRCYIKNSIIDKNVRIGDDVKIINKDGVVEGERDGIFFKEGIAIISKNMILANGTVI